MIRFGKIMCYFASSFFSFVIVLLIVKPELSITTNKLGLTLSALSGCCFGYCLTGLWEKVEKKTK